MFGPDVDGKPRPRGAQAQLALLAFGNPSGGAAPKAAPAEGPPTGAPSALPEAERRVGAVIIAKIIQL